VLRRFRPHLTYSNVIATWQVALVVLAAAAIGGVGGALAVGGKSDAPKRTVTVQSRGGKKYVTNSVPAVDNSRVQARCPKGTHVSGGGAGTGNFAGDVNESKPYDGGDADSVPDDGWSARFNDTGGLLFTDVFAICE
jgi:hypothetical protein